MATKLEVDNGSHFATLIRWDLSSVPAIAEVESVTLEIDVTNPTSDTYEIYALKRDWSEGQVSWESATNQGQWELAGAQGVTDISSTVLGTLTSSSTGRAAIELNAVGVATVQSWIQDPSSNFGFVIQDYENASNGIDFSSSESTTMANRPKLSMTYLVSNTPAVNRAPVVDAGQDQNVRLSVPVTLGGRVANDGLPADSVSTNWRKVIGPGEVSFGDASSRTQRQSSTKRVRMY